MVDVINFVCLHHLEESAHAQADQFSMTMGNPVKVDIEDIAWTRGDTNFIFECWKYLSRVSEANEWETLSAREPDR